MNPIKKILLATAATAALATPALADVKLGYLAGFSGPIEQMAPAMGSAAELVAAHVNAQGGILGGETLQILTGDSACDPTQAASAADRMINTEKVTALGGPSCTGATIAAAENVGIPSNTIIISPSATAGVVTSVEDNDLLFRVAPSDDYQTQVLARLLKSKGLDNLAIAHVNNDYGKGLADGLQAAFTELGGNVAGVAAHEDGKSDYRAELGNLASTGGEALVILAYASSSGKVILRQAVEDGDFSTFVGADGMVSDELTTGLDASAVEGMIITKPSTPDLPGSAIFADLATKAQIDPTAIFAPQSYDAMFLLALAIEKRGEDTREGLVDALRSVSSAPGEIILPGEWEKAVKLIKEGKDINYEGASGRHDFDANGDVPGVIVEVAVEGGALVEKGEAK